MRVIDLDQQRRALSNYDHLDRFGGKYAIVLGGLYRIARELVVSILNDHGDIQTNRTDEQLFHTVGQLHPEHPGRILSLLTLQPFTTRGFPLPFSPVGVSLMPIVAEIRDTVVELHGLAVRVRASRTEPDGKVRVEIHAVLEVDPIAYAVASLEAEWTSTLLTDPAEIADEVRGHWPIEDTIPCWARGAITVIEER